MLPCSFFPSFRFQERRAERAFVITVLVRLIRYERESLGSLYISRARGVPLYESRYARERRDRQILHASIILFGIFHRPELYGREALLRGPGALAVDTIRYSPAERERVSRYGYNHYCRE